MLLHVFCLQFAKQYLIHFSHCHRTCTCWLRQIQCTITSTISYFIWCMIESHKRCLTILKSFSCFRNPKVTVFITFNCFFFCFIYFLCFFTATMLGDGRGCLSTIEYLLLLCLRCRHHHILFHEMKFNILFATPFRPKTFCLLIKLIEWKCRFQCENLICNFSHYYLYILKWEKLKWTPKILFIKFCGIFATSIRHKIHSIVLYFSVPLSLPSLSHCLLSPVALFTSVLT